MKKDYNRIIQFQLPENWTYEETEEEIAIYNPLGKGAMTVSLYSMLNSKNDICEQISVMAKKYIDQNKIKLDQPLIVYVSPDDKYVLYGIGNTEDDWFIKFWMISKYPRIIHASYLCEKKSKELKIYDRIVNSIEFL